MAGGHAPIYAPPRPRWGPLWRFLAARFPRQVGAAWAFCLSAGLLLFGAAGVGAALAILSPETAVLPVPEQFAESLQHPPPGQSPLEGIPAGFEALLGSMMLTNNSQVGFFAFALGIAFGVGTVNLLLQNGLLIGALTGALGRGENGLIFWSLIVPHGGMELLAIYLRGGSGLLLGWSLIDPGDYRRRDGLVAAGRRTAETDAR